MYVSTLTDELQKIGGAFLAVADNKSFGQLLGEMIADSNLSNREFYEKLNIKKVYFYDIINGRMKPPPADKQIEIIKILNPNATVRNMFFELAAKERNEFPADLKIFMDKESRNNIRNSADFNGFIESYIESFRK